MKSANFDILETVEIADLVLRLEKFIGRFQESKEQFQRTYYDSFDWRLYGQGFTLDAISEQPYSLLSLRPLEDGSEVVSLRYNKIPGFVWDLPQGVMRNRLKPIIEMRTLLPQVRISCRRINLNQLNKDAKTVLRLRIDQESIIPVGGREKALTPRLILAAVKGYNKPYNKALAYIQQELGLPFSCDSPMIQALAALDRNPMDYSSKLRIQLDPLMRSDASTKSILRHLLAALQINQPGMLQNLDSEFLHDYRVAVRRTRSALTQIKGVFPSRKTYEFSGDFAWLGDITSQPRDLDVYLLNFEHYKSALPLSVGDDLDPLRDFLEERCNEAYRKLCKTVVGKRYQTLLDRWQSFLDAPLPEAPAEPNARIPTLALADRRIRRLYRKVCKEGSDIDSLSPAEKLHDLRKTCKKLRYMIEFFQSLYPKKQVRQAIKILKGLQVNLGDFQDYEVQETSIKHFSEDMIKAGKTPARTLLAMGVLVLDLETKRLQAREEFSARFGEFMAAKHQALFKNLFAQENSLPLLKT